MIAKAIAYTASDGRVYPSLAEAQAAELQAVLREHFTEVMPSELEKFCSVLVACADKVVNVLTTTPTSRPARRKANGYPGNKRKRTAAGSTQLTAAANESAKAAVSV